MVNANFGRILDLRSAGGSRLLNSGTHIAGGSTLREPDVSEDAVSGTGGPDDARC